MLQLVQFEKRELPLHSAFVPYQDNKYTIWVSKLAASQT